MTDGILKMTSKKTGALNGSGMSESVISGNAMAEDEESDILSLRPERLNEYIGQEEVKEALGIRMPLHLL